MNKKEQEIYNEELSKWKLAGVIHQDAEAQARSAVEDWRESKKLSDTSTKPANVLAREYEVGTTKEEFFEYIVLSEENGQSKQMHDLFNRMEMHDKEMFLLYCQQGEFIDIIRQIAVRNL